LSKLGHITVDAEVDERKIEAENNDKTDTEISKLIALAKARTVANKYPDDIVIGADTFAVMPDGRRMSKPSNNDEAIKQSIAQSGKTIKVFTGVAIIYAGQEYVDSSYTEVSYIEFSKDLIRKLTMGDDGTVRNAGLGFFDDAPGFSLVKSFSGSYTGAMGLPMEIVRPIIDSLEDK
jgi:septum formation protein